MFQMERNQANRLYCVAIGVCFSAFSHLASAADEGAIPVASQPDTEVDSSVQADTSQTPSAMAPDVPRVGQSQYDGKWHFNLGLGVMVMPKYPGANTHKADVLPIVGATNGRFFVGAGPDSPSPFGVGVYLFKSEHFRVGTDVSYDFISPRKASDDSRLRGLGDVYRTAHASIFASYDIAWLTAKANIATDIGGKDEGTVGTFDVLGKYEPIPGVSISAGPGLTYGSSQYMETFYGVTGAQSARSGLQERSASGGLSTIRFSFNTNYKISEHWGLGTQIAISRLTGDAADSPIVRSKNQLGLGVFANYRF